MIDESVTLRPLRLALTRRKRVQLILWHLRIAWDHLWALVKVR